MNIINMDMKNMDISSIVKELKRIPKWLGILLLVVCVFGGSYWLFTQTENSVTNTELKQINTDILRINRILNNSVCTTDYLYDYANIDAKINILREMIMYDMEVRAITLEHLDHYMRHHGAPDAEANEFRAIRESYSRMINSYDSRFQLLDTKSHVNSAYAKDE